MRIKEHLIGVGKCNKERITILDSTTPENYTTLLNSLCSEYKNVFKIVFTDEGENTVIIKGCEDINTEEVTFD